MSVAPSLSPTLIDTQDGFHHLIDQLRNQPRIAVDTESNSLFAYQERVCLIQFSIPGFDYLVDPIVLHDLQPLKPIFQHPVIEKVLHGAEYDLICLKRDFGFRVTNLFDTRIAARTLGWAETSLADLIQRDFDVHINKRYQRADWGKRPLSEEMQRYASLDTHYLLSLRDILMATLEGADRKQEALEACTYLAENDQTIRTGYDLNGYWRLSQSQRLAPREISVLKEVYAFRDQEARRLDTPPFKILSDQILLSIALVQPKNKADLRDEAGLSKLQIRRHGQGLLAAIKRGLKIDPPTPPARDRPRSETIAKFEALRKWRRKTAKARGVESDVILPREVLWSIAEKSPGTASDLLEVMKPLNWRFETYGQEILEVLSAKKSSPIGE